MSKLIFIQLIPNIPDVLYIIDWNIQNHSGNIDKAKTIFEDYVNEGNEMNEILTSIQYTVWAGDEVFKRNTADDFDKKLYSYSLTVNK